MNNKITCTGKNISHVLIYIVAVIGVLSIVGAFAYQMHKLETENVLQSHRMEYSGDLSVEENFPDTKVEPGSTKTKEVVFKNTSSAPVFIRVSFSENWETTDLVITDDISVIKNWTASWLNDWEKKPDGWWYYKKVLPAGASTAAVLSSVTFPAEVPAGADYALTFNVEAVQASDESSVNNAATSALFGRAGTISNMTLSNGAVKSGNVSWN